MFRLFKKTDNRVYAPVSGKCIDIDQVNDVGFSSKVMGDGIAIETTNSTVKAPCNGTIEMIFPTKHALGITADNGLEMMIHIGIDTVNEQGKGFRALKKQGDPVRKGEKIIEFDLDALKEKYDMTTMVIITNGAEFHKCAVNEVVDENSCILERIVSKK